MKRTASLVALLAPALLLAQVINKPKLALRNWATGFNTITTLANCGDSRMFVVERAGVVKIISDSMTVAPQPFLDISDEVNSGQNEQGLLGLAFDPNYLESGIFYVYYIHGTGSGNTRISRFHVSNDPDLADLASEEVIYEYPQPEWNHNGGDMHFGPDGLLYVGLGDGGGGNDQHGSQGNGQDYTDPLGGMIRIDVSDPDTTYTIPPSNPFSYESGADTLPEIWATGLRNPWRWSFDRLTGNLWIGDVGQDTWEEVDTWPAGDNSCPNFGWRCREAFVATPGVSQTGCQGAANYVAPLAAFAHSGQGWCSVIGGYVYRGSWYPHHAGHYIFTDYCAGDFLTFSDETNTDVDTMLMTTTTGYAAFGQDLDGQLYVGNELNGQVKKIYDPCPMNDPEITADNDLLTATAGSAYQWYLNGVAINGATSQSYLASVSGDYQVRVDFGSPCNLFSGVLDFVVSGLEEGQEGHLAVFPQPARDMVTLERASAKGAWTVRVLDALGRAVMTTNWPEGRGQLLLSVASLATGSYTVRCETAAGAAASATHLIINR